MGELGYMKKYIILFCVISILPFAVRPNNFLDLYAPFLEKQYLLASAIMPEPKSADFFTLAWPDWIIRFIVSKTDFKFSENFEDNQSKLQFILTGLYDNEEHASSAKKIEYVLSLAKRSISEGSNVNNMNNVGVSALHEAIIFNSTMAVDFLLENGADCYQSVSRSGKSINRMTSLQLAEFLPEKDNKNRTKVIERLKFYGCSGKKQM